MDERDYKAMNEEIKHEQMTVVEWLFEQVVNRTERVYFLKELEQAKALFEQHIIAARISKYIPFLEKSYKRRLTETERLNVLNDAKEYYNETFKSE